MGKYVRWQAILSVMGIVLLGAYLNSINVIQTIVVVPAEGGIFREGLVGRPQFLNPLLAVYNPVDQDITTLIFEGLTRDDGLGNLEPVLAQDWSVSDDGRVYVFKLRQDVRWSDGVPLTSDDVVFTFNLIQANDFPGDPSWQRLWQSVEVEQIDPLTVHFILSEPFPSFVYYTTIGILPQHILGNIAARDLLTHPFNLSPVGTGPFKLVEATDQHVLLRSNPRYYRKPAQIEQIEFKFYPDLETLAQAFEAQEIEGLGRISADMLRDLQTQANLQFFSAPLPRYAILYFNLRQVETLSFFQEQAVRQALLISLDRQALVDNILDGQAIVATGPILPWSWAYNPNQVYPRYDPSEAAALLDSVGWSDADGDGIREREGQLLKFTLLTSNDPTRLAVANYLTQQWRNLDIDVQVEAIGDDLSQRLENGQFESALVAVQLFGDPDPYPYWHQTQIDGGQNFAGWDDVAASQMLEQARTTVDRNERVKYYYEFQNYFAEQIPAIILYYPVYTYVIRDTVNNVQLAALSDLSDRFSNIRDWYLLTRRVIETETDQRLDNLN